MSDQFSNLINQAFEADEVTPAQLDRLLEQGWRHFGTYFFRYNLGFYELDVRAVIPLRIRLVDFSLSKSQRRNLRQNTDLKVEIGPIDVTPEAERLFDSHKRRFKSGIPASIYDFLSKEPATVPCRGMQVAVFNDHRLVALSYFDVGGTACSGIYAMFEPELACRGLGTLTMLKEIEFAGASRKTFYYQGYSYSGNSFYDYKRRFRGTECFDWRGNWIPLDREG